jgi:hypothetical protein
MDLPMHIDRYGIWVQCKYLYTITDLHGWELEDDYELVLKWPFVKIP